MGLTRLRRLARMNWWLLWQIVCLFLFWFYLHRNVVKKRERGGQFAENLLVKNVAYGQGSAGRPFRCLDKRVGLSFKDNVCAESNLPRMRTTNSTCEYVSNISINLETSIFEKKKTFPTVTVVILLTGTPLLRCDRDQYVYFLLQLKFIFAFVFASICICICLNLYLYLLQFIFVFV